MLLFNNPPERDALRLAITAAYRMDETACLEKLLALSEFSEEALERIAKKATELVIYTREQHQKKGKIETFLQEYDLSSDEGIALMCLAEALLRIPDTETIDRLIGDKISTADWQSHANQSLFVNAATWSLMLTGKILSPALQHEKTLMTSLARLASRAGGAFIRPVILAGMKIIGKQFVMGETIQKALIRAEKQEKKGYRYSYDCLGEAARTAADAENYLSAYHAAIRAIGEAVKTESPIQNPGISIKLSALHPRYECAKRERVLHELVPRLLSLAQAAKAAHINMTIDAEEADRLELSLDVIEAVFCDASLEGWEGFGLAVQSYQKRAPFVIDWLAALATRQKRKLMVRLIKGAYWDAEIKTAQVLGLEGYPVFTRKNATDVSFIACAKKILSHPTCFYAQFGTHNAHSVATILELVGDRRDFEFQCLHGMGEPLYDQLTQTIPCRVYAPVGHHQQLLGYLVRRLLENGANTSFINRLADPTLSIDTIIADPIARIAALSSKPHPHIPLPHALYGSERLNSSGIDFSNDNALTLLKQAMEKEDKPLSRPVIASTDDVEKALNKADKAKEMWANTSVSERAACLERAADLFETYRSRLITILCREGKKHIVDCASEVREAIDFCRYYALRARRDLATQSLTGPTGETNTVTLHPRGMIICISPWNFPLAIFIGQVVAALVAGNTVIAKPAEQTPLIAAEAVRLLHEGGIPTDVVQCVIGKGSVVGPLLISDRRINGVMFTGSTETAQFIQKTLSNRPGPILPFIAETGGQNVMIVDSSALPEQVVADVVQSAFNSAGQRCSALRVLFVQDDIADVVLPMLKGAMAEWVVGDSGLLSTDVGPVIDQKAYQMLQMHFDRMMKEAMLIAQIPMDATLSGDFFAPCAFEIKNISQLQREVFGPILHIIRYPAKQLDRVLDDIISTGYGLTLGIHSRIDSTIQYIQSRMPVGNIYVNRNMIGAVVGVQPFGGEGLSGTGPKAGGPHYLPRLCVERTVSRNTTASGGNATLVSLAEDDDHV